MHDAPRYDPLEESAVLPEGQLGAAARGRHGGRAGMLNEDELLYTGKIDGAAGRRRSRSRSRARISTAARSASTSTARRATAAPAKATAWSCSAATARPAIYHIDRLRHDAGRLLLRRDHERLRRDAGLQRAGHASRIAGASSRTCARCSSATTADDGGRAGRRSSKRLKSGEPAQAAAARRAVATASQTVMATARRNLRRGATLTDAADGAEIGRLGSCARE